MYVHIVEINEKVRQNFYNDKVGADGKMESYKKTVDYKTIATPLTVSNDFKKANFPMIIIGDEVLQNDCSLEVQKIASLILKKSGGFWGGFWWVWFVRALIEHPLCGELEAPHDFVAFQIELKSSK